MQLGPRVNQCLGRVVADDRALAVRRAGLLRGIAVDDLLFATQVAGKRFVAWLLGLGPALDRVGLDDRFGLCLRLGPSGLELLAVFERQPILVGGGDDSLLAAMAVDEMAEQLAELFQFEAEFLELLALRRIGRGLRGDIAACAE